MKGFPTRTPADLEDRPRHQQWLVDGLWGRHAVGIVGGEPKCGKSFLALDLAVAVAAGVPCLRNFAAERPGPVLLFAAEDAGHIVRTRLQGIAKAADADFETLDIAVIDAPALRLDHRNDRQRLLETVERIRPTRSGSRHSRMQPASASDRPSRRSAPRNRTSPPSDEISPPAKSAVTFLRLAAGRSNGRGVSSVMAGVVLSLRRWKDAGKRISTRSQRLIAPGKALERGMI